MFEKYFQKQKKSINFPRVAGELIEGFADN